LALDAQGSGAKAIIDTTRNPDVTRSLGDPRLRVPRLSEVPEGARLWFDQPLDLGRGKIGRLKSGQFDGPVTIRSDCKEPGPEDDLLIVTHDTRDAAKLGDKTYRMDNGRVVDDQAPEGCVDVNFEGPSVILSEARRSHSGHA